MNRAAGKKCLGKAQRAVMAYLEMQARNCPEFELKTATAYMTAREILVALNFRTIEQVDMIIQRLLKRQLIKVYPNGRRNKRCYGVSWLPSVTYEDIQENFRKIVLAPFDEKREFVSD